MACLPESMGIFMGDNFGKSLRIQDLCAMLVMKFGGASVKDATAVRNVGNIIRQFVGEPLLIVVSAMDKTTNQLEKLAALARDCDEPAAWDQFEYIKDFHRNIVRDLDLWENQELTTQLAGYFSEIERVIRGLLLLGEFPSRTYDRIVSYGEMLSTAIVSHHLQASGLGAQFLDVRKIIKTDTTFTQARVIWSQTEANILEKVKPMLTPTGLVVTQGFIASSLEGKITTLGREGSDFTGAIFANCLNASRFLVWKDVRGILTADPRIQPDARKHDRLTYEQAVEMTFFGATVIHPKTIKPLYAKHIPLEVKCFADITETGTRISSPETEQAPSQLTSTIVKKNQVLLRIRSKDFSFMKTSRITDVFRQVSQAGVKMNLVQTTAISLNLCLDNDGEPVSVLESVLSESFFIEKLEGLVLTTYLNYHGVPAQAGQEAVMLQQVDDKLFVVSKME